MILVEPTVHWISKDGFNSFLEKRKIKWRPEAETFEENLFEFAGRLCYESWETEGGFENKNLTKIREGNKNYLSNLIKQGHLSVFEHGGPLVFLFENVSRVFTHELVRHRVGCAYSQTSGRYVRGDNIKFWLPPSLNNVSEEIIDTVTLIEHSYKRLESLSGINKMTDFADKKKLTSALRRILPNGQANNILMSLNHRAMRHIITMRTSAGAEEEMRLVIGKLAETMKTNYPAIYQDMKEENGAYFFA